MDVEIFVVKIDNKTDIDCYLSSMHLQKLRTDLGMNFWIVIDDIHSYIFNYCADLKRKYVNFQITNVQSAIIRNISLLGRQFIF